MWYGNLINFIQTHNNLTSIMLVPDYKEINIKEVSILLKRCVFYKCSSYSF
ncbi:Uncharacterised protein [Prevotella pallens]|uniref:Uncharacterized protein n=1 Tax=Prevotella pallens TaxID=60133 RepID=A0A379F2M3_9BACT|nr:Uncharacterised protein [Prevotella pallens]